LDRVLGLAFFPDGFLAAGLLLLLDFFASGLAPLPDFLACGFCLEALLAPGFFLVVGFLFLFAGVFIRLVSPVSFLL
jgi:hypothetical protein